MNKIEDAFNFWISQSPNSGHPNDTERYYKLVEAVAASNASIDRAWLEERINESTYNLGDEIRAKILASFEQLVAYAKYKIK